MTGNEAVISVRDLVVSFGAATVLDRVTLDVFRGEILGFVGGSGAGKSVLMRTIIGLLPKRAGTIEVFGSDLASLDGRERRAVERRWGVLFQQGALFSSLTVRQNVQLHWVRIEDVPAIFSALGDCGLSSLGTCGDVTRNITGCPLAGIHSPLNASEPGAARRRQLALLVKF